MGVVLTFLGTGNAGQVPVYNCTCLACTRAYQDSRFKRRPCSALLEIEEQQWVIDSGRMDLVELFPAPSLNGILQTHYHADHAQGLLHLRWGVDLSIPVWGPQDSEGFADLYKHPGILDFSQPWQEFETRHINTMAITAVPLNHSKPCLGYVLEEEGFCLAYLTDTVGLPEQSYQWLKSKTLNYCIVDCSMPPMPSTPRNHNDVNSALEMSKGLQIEQMVFTHIGHELDTWLMQNEGELPAHVSAAYDGMKIYCR